MNLVRKISTKTVLGKKPAVPADDKPHWLFQVVGIANDKTTGETDKGPWIALLGAFQATNYETGEIYRSGRAFLPNVALDLVLGQLGAKDVQSVQFAFRIGVRADETSVTGYVYIAEPVINVTENDPLEALLAKLPGPAAPTALPSKAKEKAKTA